MILLDSSFLYALFDQDDRRLSFGKVGYLTRSKLDAIVAVAKQAKPRVD
jgi:hypothetical protein